MKKKTKIILCTASIIGVVGISGILAYLTDTKTTSNIFTVGHVKIELKEPNWESATDSDNDGIPDYADNITPNATIPKDPQVKNVGKNNSYVYLKVTIPAKNIVTANDDGTLVNDGQPQATPLYTYTPNTTDWAEIISKRTTNTNSANEVESYTYVYYYKQELEPTATTSALFNSVKFANIIDGQVDSSAKQQIDITAYAIQSDNLPADTNIEDAYTIYTNQNK